MPNGIKLTVLTAEDVRQSEKLRGCCAATLTQLIADIRRKQHAERHNPELVRGLEQAVVIAKGLAERHGGERDV